VAPLADRPAVDNAFHAGLGEVWARGRSYLQSDAPKDDSVVPATRTRENRANECGILRDSVTFFPTMITRPNAIQTVGPVRRINAISRFAIAASAICAIAVFVSTLYGAYLFFSPVPFWDQWNGYIAFYTGIKNGNIALWWTQLNEHRIIFSRILFFIDIEVFGGLNAFTVICNLILLGLLAWTLWRESKASWSAILLTALLFSWAQFENIIWGFESQCIAVYWFAFLAFSQISRKDMRNVRTAMTIALCVASTFTMGNGIAAFGAALFQALILRRPFREWIAYGVAGVMTGLIYFHDYTKIELPIDPSVAHTPLAQAKFFTAFLGNPFAFLLNYATVPSEIIGCVVFTALCVLTLYVLLKSEITPYRSFLLACLAMVMISIAGATHARWVLGISGALASRYVTPTLIVYALFLLLAYDVAEIRQRYIINLGAIALIVVISFTQLWIFKQDRSYIYERKLALLGQKIGLDHTDLDSKIFPGSAHQILINYIKEANDYQIGLWGSGWLHDAGLVRFDPTNVAEDQCVGYVDSIGSDSVGRIASGWVISKKNAQSPILVLLVDEDNRTVGYGVTGALRPDVHGRVENAPTDAGWVGFAAPDAKVLHPYALVGGKFCPFGFSRS
jgi:hypothetical protein